MARGDRKVVIFRQSDGRTLEIRTDSSPEPEGRSSQRRPKFWRRLRWVGAVVALGCFGLAVYLGFQALHERQSTQSLSEQIAAARQSGDHPRTIQLLSTQVGRQPTDTAALAELAVLIDEHARSRKDRESAFLAYEEVLRRVPHRHDLRRRLVEVADRLGRQGDALWHLDALREQFPDDPELAGLAGDCYAATNRPLEALRAHLEAVHNDPQNAERYLKLLDVLIANPALVPTREDVADLPISQELLDLFVPERVIPFSDDVETSAALVRRVFDRAAVAGRPAYSVFLAEAQYLASEGLLGEAGAAVERAVADAPENADVLQAAAEWKLAQAKLPAARKPRAAEGEQELLAEARALMEQSLAADASGPDIYLSLAEAELRSGHLDAAEEHLRSGWSRVAAAADAAGGERPAPPRKPDLEPDLEHQPDHEGHENLHHLESRFIWSLANVLLARAAVGAAGDPVETAAQVRELIRQLKGLGAPRAQTDFLEGRVLLAERHWAAGVEHLERARPGIRSSADDLVVPLNLILADGYRELARFEAELNALGAAGDREPTSVGMHLRLARFHESAGRFADALESYRVSGRGHGGHGVTGVQLARLLLLSEAVLPAERRDARRLAHAVAQAEDGGATPFELAALQADAELLLGRPQEARRILEAARDASPDQPAVWSALALLELRWPGADHPTRLAAAQRVLAEAQSRLGAGPGTSVALQLARIRLATEMPKETAQAELARIESDPDPRAAGEWPGPGDAERVMAALAAAHERIGDPVRARYWLLMLADRHPQHVPFRFGSARLAALGRDAEEFAADLALLRRLEGPAGPLGDYLESVRGIDQIQRDAGGAGRRSPGDIRRLLNRAAEARRDWKYVDLALSLLEDTQGNHAEADRHFERARTISRAELAAALGRGRDELELPRPGVRQLLGPDVFPPIHWAVRVQVADLFSAPGNAWAEGTLRLPTLPENFAPEELATIAFSPPPWPAHGAPGAAGSDGQAIYDSERSLSYSAAALEQVRSQQASKRISSRTLVLFLASLGCVIFIDLLVVERAGTAWGLAILLPVTALLLPVFFFLLDVLLDLTAG